MRVLLLLFQPRFPKMVLFQRGYSFRSRTRPSTGTGGSAPDLAGYATKSYVDNAILAAESDTDAVKQDVVEIENTTANIQTQVNDITTKAVLSDGNGNVDGTNGSSAINRLRVEAGLITRELNKQSVLPAARMMTRDIVALEEEVVEPEFLEGKIEASGTGVPADGYAFYRYDDSNLVDGLN